ncbi:MAG TPA: FtsX-like permease family protein, partial [Ktedonobacterales bacterium]|nr:FtsX-like permease family protein [Ktedonobacterales bacterium]
MRLEDAQKRRSPGELTGTPQDEGTSRATPNVKGRARRANGKAQSQAKSIWKGSHAGVFSSLRLAIMRLSRNSGLLALIALGVLVADVLICVVPLYNSLVTDIQLQTTLSANDSVARNIETVVTSSKISPKVSQFANDAVLRLGAQQIGSFTSPNVTYYLMTDPFLLTQAGKHTYNPAAARPPQGQPEAFDYGNDPSSAASHMRLIAGRFPQPTPAGATPEVIITQEMANNVGIGVGSTITLAQFGAHQNQFHARVVGVWTPRNPNELYWNGLSFSAQNGGNEPRPYPILMSETTLLTLFGRFPGLNMNQHWVFYSQSARLNASNIGAISNDIAALRSKVDSALLGEKGITQTAVNTGLDQLIANIQGQQGLLALPLYVVVAQIVALALLFVAAMVSLLSDRQAGEIATLKSRGASGTQILGIFAAQGGLLGLLALVVSPFLAALAVLALVRAFIPASVFSHLGVNASYFTQLANPKSVLLPALAGALSGVVVIGLSAWQTAQRDVLAFRREQGRSAGQPFWQRYYLDLGLVALCAVGYLELGQFGGASTRLQL